LSLKILPFFRLSTNSSRQGICFSGTEFRDKFEYYLSLLFVKKPTGNTPRSRREFARKTQPELPAPSLLGATSLAESAVPAPAKRRKNLLQHVGGDYHVVMADPSIGWNEKQKLWTTKRNFEYHERCGVRHFTNIMSVVWDADEMKR
jgi:hypothetical protein